jgi:hypothetical protein
MDDIFGFYNEFILPILSTKIEAWLLLLVTILYVFYTKKLVHQAIESSMIANIANNIELHDARITALHGIEDFQMEVNVHGYNLGIDQFRSLNQSLNKIEFYFSDEKIDFLVKIVRNSMDKAMNNILELNCIKEDLKQYYQDGHIIIEMFGQEAVINNRAKVKEKNSLLEESHKSVEVLYKEIIELKDLLKEAIRSNLPKTFREK